MWKLAQPLWREGGTNTKWEFIWKESGISSFLDKSSTNVRSFYRSFYLPFFLVIVLYQVIIMEGQSVFFTNNPKYTYGLNRFIEGSLKWVLSVSDLVQSEWAYQRQAKQVKKPSATVSGPIGRFLVHVDKNQQTLIVLWSSCF